MDSGGFRGYRGNPRGGLGFRGRGMMRGGNGSGFNSRGGGQMIMRGGFNSRGRGFPRGGFNSGGFRGNGMSNGRGSDRGDRGGRGRFPLNPPNQGSNGPPQQHQVAPNPVPQPVVSQETTPEKTIPSVTTSNNVVVSGNQNQGPPQSNNANNNGSISSPMSRGAPRGQRGSFVPRGSISRGRGNFSSSQGPPRQFDTRQPSNTTTVTPINKRGGYNNGGPPGPPKRGRYEGLPTRQGIPKPPYQMNQQSSQVSQPYSPPMSHHSGNSGGYQDPNQHSQYSDQYSSHSSYSHSAPPVQSQNNSYLNGSGYGQNTYGGNNAQAQMSYTQPAEYDHGSGGGYQDYNAPTSYSSHDTRYQSYSQQDYSRQSYAAPTDTYGSTQPAADYGTGQYDERSSYGNYDSYSQSYMKSEPYQAHTGYY